MKLIPTHELQQGKLYLRQGASNEINSLVLVHRIVNHDGMSVRPADEMQITSLNSGNAWSKVKTDETMWWEVTEEFWEFAVEFLSTRKKSAERKSKAKR